LLASLLILSKRDLSLRKQNPGELLCSPGFGFVQPCLAFSGRPIGEPRFNNRYYDYDANYDAVKKEIAGSHVYFLAGSQCGERELETTIGHKRSDCELKLAALKKRAEYRSSSPQAPLNCFYQQINRLYLSVWPARRSGRFHGDQQT
jgi:hypothetical protein